MTRRGAWLAIVLGAVPALVAACASPDAHAADARDSVVLVPAQTPINGEALVYRPWMGGARIDLTKRERPAHPRNLQFWRALRAYPGAPPRIPHGLTAEELHGLGCRTCHERGGYSARFEAYVPVTPHPDWVDCLSCHLPDAGVAGIQLPHGEQNATCRQCHAAGGPAPSVTPVDWRPAAWPALPRDSGVPPVIPHDVTLRGNCIACHAGPAAVAELRTPHPERQDCRQCHVIALSAEGYNARP